MNGRPGYSRGAGASGRPRWSDRVRTLMWVVAVTVMVWIYADMTKTSEETFTMVLELHAGGELTLLSKPEIQVEFTAQGSDAGLKEFKLKRLRYDVSGLGASADPIPLPVKEILEKSAAITEAGLTPISTDPPTIGVHLDRVLEQELEVELDWQPDRSWRVGGNASFSHNRIDQWTQFYDVYDRDGAYLDRSDTKLVEQFDGSTALLAARNLLGTDDRDLFCFGRK